MYYRLHSHVLSLAEEWEHSMYHSCTICIKMCQLSQRRWRTCEIWMTDTKWWQYHIWHLAKAAHTWLLFISWGTLTIANWSNQRTTDCTFFDYMKCICFDYYTMYLFSLLHFFKNNLKPLYVYWEFATLSFNLKQNEN